MSVDPTDFDSSVPPDVVLRGKRVAAKLGFELSTSDDVGRLLAMLAAAVPAGGTILELGTGAGVGLAWIVEGLGSRSDVTVRSIETNEALTVVVRELAWPTNVAVVHGDALHELARGETYDLVFADAQGGKLTGLDLTIAALRPGGILLMDDMDPVPDDPFHVELFPAIDAAGTGVLEHPDLAAVRLAHGTGVVMATKRAAPGQVAVENAQPGGNFTAQQVLGVVGRLEDAGIDTWLDGGWGIDALLGVQSRPHDDLDLVIDTGQLDQAQTVLGEYRHAPEIRPGLPARLVLVDDRGHQIDVHPVEFDASGNGWQPLGGGAWARYSTAGLSGKGTVGGESVRCLSADLQLWHHLGYPWDERDRLDMTALAVRFGLALPPNAGAG